jgi:hypothetical protein
MSIDEKFGRFCDECGRTITSAVRIHLGRDYCRACYQTTFVKVACSACGDSMRAHRNSTVTPVCGKCVRSARTCLRCGKFTPIAGKLVGQSAVCKACAPHFRESRPCTCCGRLSARISKPLILGLLDEVCDSCRNSLNHATCSVCNRYRPIRGQGDDDRPYCKDCVPTLRLTHACPSCGDSVSGGGLGRCRPCINIGAIRRDSDMVAAQLEQLWMREVWLEFVEGQVQQRNANPAWRSRVNQAAAFFQQVERHFKSLDEISSDALCRKVGSRFLRKHLLASRFLVAHLQLEGFEEARQSIAERQRAEEILMRCVGKPWHEILVNYLGQLRRENTAPRTARLYLRAAEAFCMNAHVDGSKAWSEAAMLAHLKHSPGTANSLSRFVAHCRDCYGWDVCVPDKTEWASPSLRVKRAVESVRKALRAAHPQPVEKMPMKAVVRVLAAAFGVAIAKLSKVPDVPSLVQQDGSILVTEDGLVEQGNPLHPFAKRWVELVEIRSHSKRDAVRSLAPKNSREAPGAGQLQ